MQWCLNCMGYFVVMIQCRTMCGAVLVCTVVWSVSSVLVWIWCKCVRIFWLQGLDLTNGLSPEVEQWWFYRDKRVFTYCLIFRRGWWLVRVTSGKWEVGLSGLTQLVLHHWFKRVNHRSTWLKHLYKYDILSNTNHKYNWLIFIY